MEELRNYGEKLKKSVESMKARVIKFKKQKEAQAKKDSVTIQALISAMLSPRWTMHKQLRRGLHPQETS